MMMIKGIKTLFGQSTTKEIIFKLDIQPTFRLTK